MFCLSVSLLSACYSALYVEKNPSILRNQSSVHFCRDEYCRLHRFLAVARRSLCQRYLVQAINSLLFFSRLCYRHGTSRLFWSIDSINSFVLCSNCSKTYAALDSVTAIYRRGVVTLQSFGNLWVPRPSPLVDNGSNKLHGNPVRADGVG